jgi:hypothetical protein
MWMGFCVFLETLVFTPKAQQVERQRAHNDLLNELALLRGVPHKDQSEPCGNNLVPALDLATTARNDRLERHRIVDAGDVELDMDALAFFEHEIRSDKGSHIVQINEDAGLELPGSQDAYRYLSFRLNSTLTPTLHRTSLWKIIPFLLLQTTFQEPEEALPRKVRFLKDL